MDTDRHFMYQGILLVGLSILVIGGNAAWVWGESSFSGVEPFAQGFTLTRSMSAYDPRTLLVSFGEPYELQYVTPSGKQAFNFEVLLDAPVDIEPDAGEAQPVLREASSEVPGQQPNAIPEPSTLVLLGLGFLLLASRRWQTSHKKRI